MISLRQCDKRDWLDKYLQWNDININHLAGTHQITSSYLSVFGSKSILIYLKTFAIHNLKRFNTMADQVEFLRSEYRMNGALIRIGMQKRSDKRKSAIEYKAWAHMELNNHRNELLCSNSKIVKFNFSATFSMTKHLRR